MKKIQTVILMVLLWVATTFIGCATTDVKSTETTQAGKIKNPVKMVGQLGPEIAAAREESLDVLSPTWFPRAELAYRLAQEGLERGDEISSILENVHKTRTCLVKAGENAETARTILGPVIKERETARLAGAARLREDYNRAEEKFLSLTRAIEDNNLRYIQNFAERIRQQFKDLEMRANKMATGIPGNPNVETNKP